MIYGYACGLNMTRRGAQLMARDKGELAMTVSGQPPQKSSLYKLIWNVRELIADLSLFYHLQPGDLIFTGTPEGVGPLVTYDRIDGHITRVSEITLHIEPAES